MATRRLRIITQPAPATVGVTLDVDHGDAVNAVLDTVDRHHRAGGDPIRELRNDRTGEIFAWVEAVAGTAPGGTAAAVVNRGALIHAARDDWEGDPPRTLKAGRQTLLEQYGG